MPGSGENISGTPQLANKKPISLSNTMEITGENIEQILKQAEGSSLLFRRALRYIQENISTDLFGASPIQRVATESNQMNIDLETENKILIHLIQNRPDFSRLHDINEIDSFELGKKARDVVAFHAWLLGSENGQVFTRTKESGETKFTFIHILEKSLPSVEDWKRFSPIEQYNVILRIEMILGLAIPYIETKLSNPLAISREVVDVYNQAKAFLNDFETRYSGKNSYLLKIRNNLINNAGIYGEKWNSALLLKISEATRWLMEYNYPLLNPENVARLRTVHAITSEFRSAQLIARMEPDFEEGRNDALLRMSRIFREFFAQRCTSCNERHCTGRTTGVNCPHRLCRTVSLESKNELAGFKEIIPKYFPHNTQKETVAQIESLTHGENILQFTKKDSPLAKEGVVKKQGSRAELDAFSNTLRSIPKAEIPLEHFVQLLNNIVSGDGQHTLADCEGYVLLIIDTILDGIMFWNQKISEHFKCSPQREGDEGVHVNTFVLFDKLQKYLEKLVTRHTQSDFIGQIKIRLASIYTSLLEESKTEDDLTNLEKATTLFLDGFAKMNGINDESMRAITLQLGSNFLRTYRKKHLVDISGGMYNYAELSPENPNADQVSTEAKNGLTILEATGKLAEHTLNIEQNISNQIGRMSVKNHRDIPGFLSKVQSAIQTIYGDIFHIEIGERGSFSPKFGDILYSGEISIGYGYYARIDYPIENRTIVSSVLDERLKEGSIIQHGKLTQLLSTVVKKALAQNIQDASRNNLGLLEKLKSPDEVAEIRKREETRRQLGEKLRPEFLLEEEKYAAYARLFLSDTGRIEFTISYQNKKLGTWNKDTKTWSHHIVGSEFLINARDPMSNASIPVLEVFEFLDILGVYPDISRIILTEAFLKGGGGGEGGGIGFCQPFSVNTRGIEFANNDFSNFLIGLAEVSNVQPKDVTIEIVENDDLVLKDPITLTNLRALKAAGFHISLDDFGTKASYYGRYDSLKKAGILGNGDEVKFDAVYKDSLQEISNLIGDKLYTLEDVQKLSISSTTKSFLGLIAEMRELKMSATIEQIEPNEEDLLHVANCLRLNVQGYIHHSKELVPFISHFEVHDLRHFISYGTQEVLKGGVTHH